MSSPVASPPAGTEQSEATIYWIPWPNANPHDAIVGTDGAVWFTDTWNGCIGMFDPATGKMEGIALAPGSNPHGIIAGAEGEVWYAAAGRGTIGRLDPSAGEIREYEISDDPVDPHTITMHGGRIWFTAPRANQYGWLEQETGQVRSFDAPLADSGPYAMASAPDGSLWITLGSNLLRVEGATGDTELIPLPHPGAQPSAVVVATSGHVWYVDRERSRLGVLDPVVREIREFPTALERAHPRALGIGPEGRIWYFEERASRLTAVDSISGLPVRSVVIPDLAFSGGTVRRIVVDEGQRRLWMALGAGAALACVDLRGDGSSPETCPAAHPS